MLNKDNPKVQKCGPLLTPGSLNHFEPSSLSSSRPNHHEYFLAMAYLISTRGTCSRRRVGCVMVNHRKHVLATGYNGTASSQPHCISFPCAGAGASSGRDLDKCEATHAEQNALLQCKDVYQIDTCYTMCSPCVTCTKLLMNTSCRRIVFVEEYPHPDSKRLWLGENISGGSNREWIKYAPDHVTDALVYALHGLDPTVRVSRPEES